MSSSVGSLVFITSVILAARNSKIDLNSEQSQQKIEEIESSISETIEEDQDSDP